MRTLKYSLLLIIVFLYSCNDRKEVSYYPNGNIKYEAEVHDGKRNGVLQSFYENGKLKSKENWKDGFVHGKVENYYEDGKLESISNWVMGQQEGVTKKYFVSGKLKTQSSYDMSQKLETVIYYENGNVDERQIYMRHKLPVYIVDFDSLGNKVGEILPPIFEAESDTIRLGETYSVMITFGLPLRGKILVYTGKYSSKTGLSDTTAVLESNDYVFKYSIKADKSGSIIIPFFFGHSPEKGDTLSVDGQLTKHAFYVIDDKPRS